MQGEGGIGCEFCDLATFESAKVFFLGELTYFACAPFTSGEVLPGGGIICPIAHRETPFDLTAPEWADLQAVLQRAKRVLDEWLRPDGYNLIWNVGPDGGQEVAHAHLHVVPRFHDEPLAGRGARWHLKQPDNRRPDPFAPGEGRARSHDAAPHPPAIPGRGGQRLRAAGAPTSASSELRRLGDALRVLAEQGLRWSNDQPYDRERYERMRRLAAEVFAVADQRGVDEIEKTLFTALTHVTPLTGGDAAIVDEAGRILLIQRADDGLWAMPGGGYDMEETAAEGVARETREEVGIEVEVTDLVGVYDSRLCGSRTALHMYQFVFLCREVGRVTPTTPDEILDFAWFGEHELPPLSGGHTVRVPDVFQYLRDRHSIFDPLGGSPG